ncbi:MAG: hypothetical protein ROO76_00565 [Terriglobia bacterium]|nr:hypothetical protein [Terriglobia bacterium]
MHYRRVITRVRRWVVPRSQYNIAAVCRPLRTRVSGCNSLPIIVFVAALCLGGCGGTPESSNTNLRTAPNTGGYAILNGSTLSGATSHWESAECKVKLELASNYWMIYSVDGVGSSTATVGAVTQWSVGSTDKDVAVPLPDPPMFAYYLTGITSIDGSTSSGSFKAGVKILETASGTQVYPCAFVLQSGPIPGFSTSH